MKEIHISYHDLTGQIMLRDAFSDKHNYIFKKPEELYDHFTKNDYGLSIKNRGRVHIVVDLDTIIDESYKKNLRHVLEKIDWGKKTVIEYKRLEDFHL